MCGKVMKTTRKLGEGEINDPTDNSFGNSEIIKQGDLWPVITTKSALHFHPNAFWRTWKKFCSTVVAFN